MNSTAQNMPNLSTSLYEKDPLAKETSWKPLKKDNTPLSKMELKAIEGSLEFHLSVVSRLFYMALIVVGSLFILYATYSLLSYEFEAAFIAVGLGYTLLGYGIYLFSKQNIPLVFNKNKNLYFKKTEELKAKDKTLLNEVHALQLLSHSTKSELNLVLANGRRVYVCSYENNDYEQIEHDAKTIAEYINKPIWNGLKSQY